MHVDDTLSPTVTRYRPGRSLPVVLADKRSHRGDRLQPVCTFKWAGRWPLLTCDARTTSWFQVWDVERAVLVDEVHLGYGWWLMDLAVVTVRDDAVVLIISDFDEEPMCNTWARDLLRWTVGSGRTSTLCSTRSGDHGSPVDAVVLDRDGHPVVVASAGSGSTLGEWDLAADNRPA